LRTFGALLALVCTRFARCGVGTVVVVYCAVLRSVVFLIVACAIAGG